jgi:hypothetical protein
VPIFLKHLEQSDEDGHLQEDGQAAGQRVELGFGVKLLHFLLHTGLVVSVLLLNLLHQRLHFLHLIGGFDLLAHKRHQNHAEDEGDDENRHAPVPRKAVHRIDAPEDKVFKCVPHG